MREAFLEELKSGGIVVTDELSAVPLRITLQETPTQFLLVAEISTTGGKQVRMAELRRHLVTPEAKASGNPRLQKELVWQQPERIAAAAARSSASRKLDFLLLASPEALALYRMDGERWALLDKQPQPNGTKTTRRLFGQAVFPEDPAQRARISLPGRTCDVDLADKLAASCRASTEPVPEGVLMSASCDRSIWRLGTDSGDWTLPDKLFLRDPSSEKAAPYVNEIAMPGPVVSLSPEAGLRAAYATVFNLSTGNYEVYRITLVCD